MKRRVFAMLICAVMLLSACGQTTQPGGTSNPGSGGSTPGGTSSPGGTSTPNVTIDPVDINFGAGAMGGNYYIIAGAMKTVAEKYCPSIKGFSVLAGSSTQFMAECQEGTIDMYMNTIDSLYFGYAGTGQQGFPEGVEFDKSNMLTVMYNNLFLFMALADTPVDNLGDVTGTVAVASPTLVGITEDLMRACGVEDPKVTSINDFNQQAQALKDGTCQVIMQAGPVPNTSTVELATTTAIKAVPITKEQAQKAIAEGPDTGLCQYTVLPAGSYDFLTEDYETIMRASLVTCNVDLPDQVVYEFTKAIFEHGDELQAVYAPMDEMTLEAIQAAADDGVIQVPIHPGARRYYEEQGIIFPDSIPR